MTNQEIELIELRAKAAAYKEVIAMLKEIIAELSKPVQSLQQYDPNAFLGVGSTSWQSISSYGTISPQWITNPPDGLLNKAV